MRTTTALTTSPGGTGARDDAAGSGGPAVEVLLTRVAGGDVAAFNDLYRQLQGPVFGLAVRLLIDRHQAQEVAQEAWLQIWQQAARFDPLKGSAAAWVMRITHARAVDRIRSANAARVRDTAAAAGNHLIASDVVVDSVLLSLEQSRLREQLPHLSFKQRQSIDLAYFGGLSLPAISELLALPLGTVKTRIRDGLLLLGRLMDQPAATP